ncbi:hypothetical protein AB0J48_32330 [Nocardia salmonicida]|uniref:hypothetical protein n=1 Tax=Nocardia salmonicida TaxID=53431 RepID=UPI00344904E2
MIVFFGLVLLIAAVVIGTAGVLSNSGPAHMLSDDFSLLGYHITATSGTLFLWAVGLGAVGMLGLVMLIAGAHRSSQRLREIKADLRLARRTGTSGRIFRPSAEPKEKGAVLAKTPRSASARRSWRRPFGDRSADAVTH